MMPTLTISIDRTSLGLDPLVLEGHEDASPSALGVTDYTEPAMQPRTRNAPTSDYVHGEMPLAWSWQETMLNFSVVTFDQATESASRALIAELRAAVSRLNYLTTVTVDGALPETWRCRPGSVTPAGSRTLADLTDHNPQWAVSLPAHPIRSVA